MMRQSNKTIRIITLAIGLGIIAFSIFQNGRPHIESGNLEFRMITGEKDGIVQVIMIETADRFTVLDSLYRDIFMDESQEIVTRPEQLRLMEKYSNIQYRLGFNQESNQEKEVYLTTRELFNQLFFDREVKYEIAKKQKDTLIKLLE